MVKDGIPFVLVPAITALVFGVFQIWTGVVVFILLAGFMAYFFRDPERNIPADPNIIVSAADGRVTRIETRADGEFVSVFLSPLDVHINRSPIAGEIVDITYTPGRKSPATSDDASLYNERNALTISNGVQTVVCTQIAGILARRIVCWPSAGDRLERGQRFGLIKFSSRTDLLLPPGTEILVKVGDRVLGGETIIARFQDG
jgi:phosphatidylserine decarboxylase